jgi:hypothetical protein
MDNGHFHDARTFWLAETFSGCANIFMMREHFWFANIFRCANILMMREHFWFEQTFPVCANNFGLRMMHKHFWIVPTFE